MKINLKLANGATLEFDGSAEEFERMSDFLANPPDALLVESDSTGQGPDSNVAHDDTPGDEPALTGLDPATVEKRLASVGVANDQERVTVIAQMAVESGKEGIDYETLTMLYAELGLPTPAQFPTKTFSNAKASGLALPVKPGIWRPTHRGSNFARGFGRGDRPPGRSSRPKGSLAPGGEDD